jgi:hypothetical protein
VLVKDTSTNYDTSWSSTFNASTATKLATARTINGVSFDGSANITVADSTKLPLTGGTMSGSISYNDVSRYWLNTATNWGIYWDTTDNRIEFHGAGTDRAGIDLDTGDIVTSGAVYGKSVGKAARVGGDTGSQPASTIANQTSYLELLAGGGGASNSSGLVFHNTGVSTAVLEYRNTDANNGQFNFKSDDANWNVVSDNGFKSGPAIMVYNTASKSLDFNFV